MAHHWYLSYCLDTSLCRTETIFMSRKLPSSVLSTPTICAQKPQKLTNCWCYVCTRKSTKIQFPKNKRVATFICQKYFYAKNSELKKFCFTIFYEVDAAMHQMWCSILCRNSYLSGWVFSARAQAARASTSLYFLLFLFRDLVTFSGFSKSLDFF